MANAEDFKHLQLLMTRTGRARLSGGGPSNSLTEGNRKNRAGHSSYLLDRVSGFLSSWGAGEFQRSIAGFPEIKSGIPMLLKVDEGLDLDDLRHHLKFEIISEEESGFVIVASEDINLATLKAKIGDFSNSITGSAIIAQIHEIVEEDASDNRINRILDDKLRNEWGNIEDGEDFIIDAAVSCSGIWDVPKKPTKGKHMRTETFERKLAEWHDAYVEAYIDWDNLREGRKEDVSRILNAYGATIIDEFEPAGDETIPDNFTMRIRLSGKALKDFISNYAYLFQVEEPEDIETPQGIRREEVSSEPKIRFVGPSAVAPAICVMDSGIQEDHLWIESAMHKSGSRCFVPSESITDVADYVSNGGHGTGVAGAILYGEEIPKSGEAKLDLWIQNARVLDRNCFLPKNVLPEKLINLVVQRYVNNDKPAKIFNHSINSLVAFSRIHMTAWAYEIDRQSFGHDILFIQSTGNLPENGSVNNPGVLNFLNNGQYYPVYLLSKSCRIANPAQSLQALSVGSVSYDSFNGSGWQTISGGMAMPSSFSRSGPGIWGSIKPDVVEFGGDLLCSLGNPPTVGTPGAASVCYPELLRSTLNGGPAFSREKVGTSFSAPKVAKLAGQIQALLPDEPALLYRALIAQSARWPDWTSNFSMETVIRLIGFGIPDAERATTNTPFRTTYITSGNFEIKTRECHVFQIPIPDSLRSPSSDYLLRIDVTLSYASEPRRTRKGKRGYLATWVDWESSRRGESIERFINRVIREDERKESQGQTIQWILDKQDGRGKILNSNRSSGTLQKDWAFLKSNEMPEDFCIAVHGHPGWNKNPDSFAKYALTVSIEIINKEIPIYQELKASVQALEAEVEAGVGVENVIEVEVD